MTVQTPWTAAHRPLTIAALLVMCATLAAAQSADRARTESQARRVNERLIALQREADTLAREARSLLGDLRRLEVERDLRTEQLRQIEADTQKVGLDLGNTGNQIAALEEQTEAARPILEARMVELYKLGSAGYVRLLFNVADLKEVGRAYRMVAAVAAIDRHRAAQHQQNLVQLRAAHLALEQRRAEMTRLQAAAAAARIAADRAAQSRAQLITDIDARRDLTAALASELQGAQQKLQQTLSAINSGTPRPATDGPALPIRPFRGDLDWPIVGRMLTPFGRGTGVSRGPAVTGVQFAASEGAQVRAVHDGVVIFTGPFTGYGNLVILDHGAQTFSLYGQLATSQVERGTAVERGHVLGTAGRILAGIPGITFEMRVDGMAVDPLEWLKKTP
ncbi:MAG TPA: peptidoglycan DD-metalloendopeptidase family protein [Vicinamibacterales bacterium]|nr:peptidoglycan DD-metalloendopeptidase family protein [Vicinamibacterales bacterium]